MPVLPSRPALWLLVATSAACVHRAPAPWVADLRIHGPEVRGNPVSGHPDLPPLDPSARPTAAAARATANAAAEVLTHPHGRWWPLLADLRGESPWPPVDPARLTDDADALRRWFVDQGWTFARVTTRIDPSAAWWNGPEEAKRWQTVRFIVDPGPRQIVGEARLLGAEDLPPDAHARLLAVLPDRGAPSSERAHADTIDALHRALTAVGHPFARASVSLRERPDDPLAQADQTALTVSFSIDLGPAPVTTSPQVTVGAGLQAAPLGAAVRRWAPPDRPWDGERLDWIRRRLEGHPEIASVEVDAIPEPDGRATPAFRITPEPHHKPTVALSTDAPGALLGVGVDIDVTRHGLGGRLASVRSRTTAVWRLFDGPPGALVQGAQTGPFVRQDLQWAAALAPLARIDLRAGLVGELVTQRGYMTGLARAEFGFGLRPTSHLQFWAVVRGGWVHHFPGILQSGAFGEAFQDGALVRSHDLLHVAVGGAVDTVQSDALLPTHGVRISLEGQPWGTARATPFSRVEARFEGYAPLTRNVTLVARGGAGLHQHDDTDGGLLANRFFLGGVNDVRGFGYRRLGAPGSRGALDDVYTGGDAMIWGSLETQIRVHPDVLTALFTDVGRIWDTPGPDGPVRTERPARAADLVPTSGLGLLVRAPVIGAVGGWIGGRWFRDIDMIDAPPRFAFHFRTITTF